MIESFIYKRKKGLWSGPLGLISLGYRAAVALHKSFYDRGWKVSYRSSLPVISIGNITVGGTGKTPVTLHLAEVLASEGKVAILSRGYRAKAERGKRPLTVSLGAGPLIKAALAGDEPYLLACRAKNALVFAGRDRKAASLLAEKAGAQVILLDDGMQHRALARDFEIVVLDASAPFGNGEMLPLGPLREPKEALRRADILFLNDVEDETLFNEALTTLRPYNSHAPAIGFKRRVIGVFHGGEEISLEGQKVALFCGIARPMKFMKTVKDLRAEIVHQKILRDHGALVGEEKEVFFREAKRKGASLVLTTEKDWVKEEDPSIAYVKIGLECVFNRALFDQFVNRVKEKIAHSI